MPIDVKEFEREKTGSGLSSEEEVVRRDLESRGCQVALSRGTGGPTGQPDSKARMNRDTIYIEVKKLQHRTDGSYGVPFTEAQLPPHEMVSEEGFRLLPSLRLGKDRYPIFARTKPL